MKIIFFGSDDFAAIHLTALFKSSHQVVACVTQPDRAMGRGLKMIESPIKQLATFHQCPCLQPATLKDESIVHSLKEFQADLFVVVAYGRLLTQTILDIPKLGCINVHGSLLPRYRGAAPINWAIINGEKMTGVTIQHMVLALDAGPIIAQHIIDISSTTTAQELRQRMAGSGAALLIPTLDAMARGAHTLTPQDEHQMSYASKLTKDMGHLKWDQSALHIERLVRGLKPWPGTYTFSQGKMLKIHEASVITAKGNPGHIMAVDKKGITVACGHDGLLITQVQPDAGKLMSAYDFAQGHHLKVGDQLT